MVDLRSHEHRYSLGHRAVFKDLCTQLFRRHLGLTDGASAYRSPNQRGVESDSVEDCGRTYAYQVKYFDAETRLRDRKAELVKCVRDARQTGVTGLLIFVMKDKWVATGGERPNEDRADSGGLPFRRLRSSSRSRKARLGTLRRAPVTGGSETPYH